jgi:hypothetical protein
VNFRTGNQFCHFPPKKTKKLKRKQHAGSEMKRKIYFASKRNEKVEAKTSENIDRRFSLEHAKTMRNESRFASFRFEAKNFLKRNRRTLVRVQKKLANNFVIRPFQNRISLYTALCLISPTWLRVAGSGHRTKWTGH